jgi:hypothetical protein
MIEEVNKNTWSGFLVSWLRLELRTSHIQVRNVTTESSLIVVKVLHGCSGVSENTSLSHPPVDVDWGCGHGVTT